MSGRIPAQKRRAQSQLAARVLRTARKGNKAYSVAKRLRRVEQVTKANAHEKKVWKYSATVTSLSFNNAVLHFPLISKGDDHDKRDGEELFWQDYALRYDIHWKRCTSNRQAHAVRIIVGFIKNNGVATGSASTIMTELFGATNPNVNAMYALKFNNGKLGTKYIILKDRLITKPVSTLFYHEGPTGTHSLESNPARKFVQIRGSMKNNHAKFLTTNNAPENMKPFVLFLTDSPTNIAHDGGNELRVEAQERIFFTMQKVL